ncbi:DUF5693 family protein [Thermanaerovibrio acidaminovorans]|uniref:DUF5693 family protein n=1 Tax=Thermanaerovibrio acidaminovorans TaxID=81462 RepID=UPI002491EB17|nr:DUF5693 family protein [Thermanaerovibrio acidaminovorans]
MSRPSLSKLSAALMLAALVISALALIPRVRSEMGDRNVGLVCDYRDLTSLAREGTLSPGALLRELKGLGLGGILVSELTGKDLLAGLSPVRLSPVRDLPFKFPQGLPQDRAVLFGPAEDRGVQLIARYLEAKFPASSRISSGANLAVVLPLGMSEASDGGLVPDVEGLEFARANGLPIIFRPSPCVGVGGSSVAMAVEGLMEAYPIRGILPAGLSVAGYPDLEPLGALIRGNGLFLAQTEFVKQVGMSNLVKESFPRVIPIHSVVRDEVFSKNITREQLVERMVRAVHERSVRLLLVRPYDLYPADRLGSFREDLRHLSSSLEARRYHLRFPSPKGDVPRSWLGALGAALALLGVWLRLRARFAPHFPRLLGRLGSMGILAALGTLGLLAIPFGGLPMRLLGALLGALGASEGALTALEEENPLRGAMRGFAVTAVAGLAIGAMYGFSFYMLRVGVFSGVKLTLVVPPAAVLLNDLLKRVYPEGREMLSRPPMWGELLVASGLLLALAFMAIRSDNTALVPQWELTLREWLERALLVRPRTKELIGYPCLFLYGWLSRRGLGGRFGEVLRIGSSLAFASALNSFCHLHTPLFLTLLRGLNGLWVGSLLGFAGCLALSLSLPLLKGVDRP